MKSQRFMAMVLAVLMATFALVACSDDSIDDGSKGDSGSVNTESALSGTTSGNGEEQYKNADGLYDPKLGEMDFDNREFRILVRGERYATYKSDDFTTTGSWMYGELIEDAVAERNNRIENRYNVKIVPVLSDYVNTDIETEFIAGTDRFDAVMPSLPQCAQLAMQNMFLDLSALDYINLDAPWWDANATSAFSISDKVYFTTGDITILNKVCSPSVLFNKTILNEAQLEDPYELVRQHEWTFDKMIEMAKAAANESDDDSKKIYGMLSAYGDPLAFYGASGESICKKDEDDIPMFSMNSTRSVNVAKKVLEAFADGDTWNKYAQECPEPIWETSFQYFHDGRALFRPSGFSATTKLRAYDVVFGILPVPLIDENQEKYISYCGTGEVAGLAIPTFVTDVDFSAFMVEACAAEAKNTITPAYYEKNLRYKDALDTESLDMLDIIFGNIVYDVGEVYRFGNAQLIFSSLAGSRSSDFVSALEANTDAIKHDIEKAIDLYEQNN